MKKRRPTKPDLGSVDALAELFDGFDYRVDVDDFVLYQLGRLIEEDRASFEEEEFRGIIDEGIREHIESRPEIRAQAAARLRLALPELGGTVRPVALRMLHTLEDVTLPVRNLSLVVRTYTAYLFQQLHDSESSSDLETHAEMLIQRWQNGEILREEMTSGLKQIGKPAVGPAANMLFAAPDDRQAAEAALETLGSIGCSSSARVLAHAISEPMLDEDLELKAYTYARALWPRPRHFILYTLTSHAHEDLPFRWFQLLIESDELSSVDLILDEVDVHAETPAYHEDLKGILELLRQSRDPAVEEKILGMLNDPEVSREGIQLLNDFIGTFRPPPSSPDNAWAKAEQFLDLNKKYLAAARLHDAGKTAEALTALNAVLAEDPNYPFAVTLKAIITGN